MDKNFENIKVGDYVLFNTGGWYSTTKVTEVTKVTPKQFECNEYRFRKSDGAMIGDTFTKCRYATQDDVERYRQDQHKQALKCQISNFFRNADKVRTLTVEELESIADIIKDK